jgi:hypothetical protein
LPSPTTQAPDGARDRGAHGVEVSADTEHDRRFGEFVREKSGGMIKSVSVSLERKNVLRVELSEATAPEDTLPMAKSLLSGARKDYPDQPITVAVYDPTGAFIMKALYEPEEGVRYEVAPSKDSPGLTTTSTRPAGDAGTASRSAPRGGLSDKDRKFADWAMSKAGDYLRYVEADLENKGRLWFGVTRAVKPDDVPALTKSLLEGARTEFPRRELSATVFDPDGERIGSATLGRDGDVKWAR